MEGLVSQHPSAHQFSLPLNAHAYPSRPSDVYAQKPLYPSHNDFYDQSFAPQPRYAAPQQSLQIQTANPAPHEHDPEEQTAHPSRSAYQLSQDADDAMDMDPEHQQSIADALTDNPGPYGGLSRPLTLQEREILAHLDRLKFFLATAPSRWNANSAFSGPDPSTVPAGHPHSAHPALNRFLLPNSEYVSCVLWGGLYHITGTDIVRALVFRFEAFGRPVRNMKKFEEGVFSDLRNLKPGADACLEEPKVSLSIVNSRRATPCPPRRPFQFYLRPRPGVRWLSDGYWWRAADRRSRRAAPGLRLSGFAPACALMDFDY